MHLVFELFAVSLVPIDTGGLFYKPWTPAEKHASVVARIQNRATASARGTEYRFANIEDSSGVVFGRITRPKDVALAVEVPESGDLVDAEFSGFAWTHFLYLPDRQVFGVLRRNEFFAGGEAGLARILEKLLNQDNNSDHTAFVEPLSNAEGFWDLVRASEGVLRLSIDFVTPNGLDSDKDLEEFLSIQRAKLGATDLHYEVRNPQGKLKVDPAYVGPAIDHVSKGGGKWSIKVKTKSQGTVTRQSAQHTKTVQIDVDGTIPESLQAFLSGLIALVKKVL